jgi:hypothetical protein
MIPGRELLAEIAAASQPSFGGPQDLQGASPEIDKLLMRQDKQ